MNDIVDSNNSAKAPTITENSPKNQREYPEWRPGKWVQSLPAHFLPAITEVVKEVTKGRFTERDDANGFADYARARNIFGRMEEAQRDVMPWLMSAIPDLVEKTVLEIGCGMGNATVPLAMASKHVHAFDLEQSNVDVARKRCEILKQRNVTLFAQDTDWIDRYLWKPESLAEDVDLIVCYALFEHLLPMERLKLLIAAWKHLPIGGYIVIIETPNRLWWFDWHSSLLPFADQLTPELAYLWNAFSDRNIIPNDIKAETLAEAQKGNYERLYRFGRGASFHEFYIAIGPNAFEVVQGEIRYPLLRERARSWNRDYIKTLSRQLADVHPPVHPAFAQPCLDIVLRKTEASRLTSIFTDTNYGHNFTDP